MSLIKAYAAQEAGGKLEPFEYDSGALGPDHLEIKVDYCGVCHSDLSMLKNDWGFTRYPFVPGHEIIGEVVELGENVDNLKLGQKVGLGWSSASCMKCEHCFAGYHNMCLKGEHTIIRRHGGFADRVRCHWSWAVPMPENINQKTAGPLFCGGITVFSPFIEFGIRPTDRVGIVGIGGLGHMAIQFAAKWGCHVTAFSSSESKSELAREMGAHQVINSREPKSLKRHTGKFDFILVTANVNLEWESYIRTIAPRGRLHFVGAPPDPVPVNVFSLMGGRKSISSSPLGTPSSLRMMLEFCERHDIAPITEHFPMSKVNDAIEHLEEGKARFRIVLENDF